MAVCERVLMMIMLHAMNEVGFWVVAGSGYKAYGSCGNSRSVDEAGSPVYIHTDGFSKRMLETD